MKAKERLFVMKRFSIRHRLSAMKVGEDAVLLGAWASVEHGPERILDAGCGCGVIALMMAQRSSPATRIEAIDLDPLAVIEAKENFAASEWSQRLHACRKDFNDMEGRFTHIVSNPPYYNSGVHNPADGRELARQAGDFSPVSLVARAGMLLEEGGRLSLICPPEWMHTLRQEAQKCGLQLSRYCRVKTYADSQPKRLLLEYTSTLYQVEVEGSELVTHVSPGIYTPAYKSLTADFHIK